MNMKIDYTKHNYCPRCRCTLSKDTLFCDDCKRRVRHSPKNFGRRRNSNKPVNHAY